MLIIVCNILYHACEHYILSCSFYTRLVYITPQRRWYYFCVVLTTSVRLRSGSFDVINSTLPSPIAARLLLCQF